MDVVEQEVFTRFLDPPLSWHVAHLSFANGTSAAVPKFHHFSIVNPEFSLDSSEV